MSWFSSLSRSLSEVGAKVGEGLSKAGDVIVTEGTKAAQVMKENAIVAADYVSEKGSEFVAASSRAVEHMRAFPTEILCSTEDCNTMVSIPAGAFNWSCQNGHSNDPNQDNVCAMCGAKKKPSFSEDVFVTCLKCTKETEVPTSNFMKGLKMGARVTGRYVKALPGKVADDAKWLAAAPAQFNCAHCNYLLLTPVGPWICQTCASENEEQAGKCYKCSQKKASQLALCGVCQRPTPIPSSNITQSLKKASQSVVEVSQKAFYTIADKPFLSCPRCQNMVVIPEESVKVLTTRCARDAARDVRGSATATQSSVSSSSSANNGVSIDKLGIHSGNAAQGRDEEKREPNEKQRHIACEACQFYFPVFATVGSRNKIDFSSVDSRKPSISSVASSVSSASQSLNGSSDEAFPPPYDEHPSVDTIVIETNVGGASGAKPPKAL